VPGSAGVEALAVNRRQVVKVAVLTNALEATGRRGGARRLRQAGQGAPRGGYNAVRAQTRIVRLKNVSAGLGVGLRLLRVQPACQRRSPWDRSRVFVRFVSIFDPRSARLNTGNGVRDRQCRNWPMRSPSGSPTKCRRRAYQVGLGDTGRLHWIDRHEAGRFVREEEPGTGVWRRFAVALLSVLPIEWLL